MSERGRKPGFKMPEEHRTKIANSKILNRLIDHVEGKCDLSATQVSAGLGLLRKVMPDISESKSEVTINRSVMRMPAPAESAEQWINRTSSGSLSQDRKPH